MARQNLLIVDGDARNRRVLEVSLRKAGFSITAAESTEEALEFLEHAAPDLIISDTRLPGDDGFVLCTKIKADARWRSIPFLFLTSEKSVEDKVRGLELGVEDYLTKPIYIKEITTRVTMLLQRKQHERLERRDPARTKFTGRLADMAVVDLLQTIEISRKSGVIHFGTELGEAQVWFRDGAVVDAAMGRLQGEPAVYRLLSLSDGDFELEFKAVNRTKVILANTQALLMEGMRRVDEWGRLMEQLPPLDAVLAVDPQAAADRQSDLTTEQSAMLRRFDGRRSIIDVVDDSGLDDLESLNAISQFFFEGLLTPSDEAAPAIVPASESAALALEAWDTPARRTMQMPFATGAPETALAHSPEDPDSELPPPPSYPEPFPQLRSDDDSDAIVAGIPEDSAPKPAFGAVMLSLEEPAVAAPPDPVVSALRDKLNEIDGGGEDLFEEGPPPPPDPDAPPPQVQPEHPGPDAIDLATAVRGSAPDPLAGIPFEDTPRPAPLATFPPPGTPEPVAADQTQELVDEPEGAVDLAEAQHQLEPVASVGRVKLRRITQRGIPALREVNRIRDDRTPPDDREGGEPGDGHGGGEASDFADGSDEHDVQIDIDAASLVPMSEQVSPPVGVPRASASGLFAVSSIPDPDPPTIPPYVGDVEGGVGLEGRLDAELGPEGAPRDEPPTMELETRDDSDHDADAYADDDDDDDAAPPPSLVLPRDVEQRGRLEDVEGVRVLVPAQESGPWNRAAHEDRDEDHSGRRNRQHGSAGSSPPYGLIAGVIVAAAAGGFFYGLVQEPVPPGAGPPLYSAPAQVDSAVVVQTIESRVDPPTIAPPTDLVAGEEARLGAEVDRARELHEAGNARDALVLLKAVIDADPKHAGALVLQSSIFIEERSLDEAYASASAAVGASPDFPDGHLALGVIQQERGHLKDAVAGYRRYLELAPTGIYARTITRQLERIEARLANGEGDLDANDAPGR